MTFWQWFWLINAVLPLVGALAWRAYRSWRSARNVRETMAYRRAKFGGFTTATGLKDPVPLDRPSPWTK